MKVSLGNRNLFSKDAEEEKKKPREVNLPFNAMFLLKALPIK